MSEADKWKEAHQELHKSISSYVNPQLQIDQHKIIENKSSDKFNYISNLKNNNNKKTTCKCILV